jgi:hypothetical protein
MSVSGDELPREADYDEVNSRLNQGLQNCRSMIANYRHLLAVSDAAAANDDEAPNREGREDITPPSEGGAFGARGRGRSIE